MAVVKINEETPYKGLVLEKESYTKIALNKYYKPRRNSKSLQIENIEVFDEDDFIGRPSKVLEKMVKEYTKGKPFAVRGDDVGRYFD